MLDDDGETVTNERLKKRLDGLKRWEKMLDAREDAITRLYYWAECDTPEELYGACVYVERANKHMQAVNREYKNEILKLKYQIGQLKQVNKAMIIKMGRLEAAHQEQIEARAAVISEQVTDLVFQLRNMQRENVDLRNENMDLKEEILTLQQKTAASQRPNVSASGLQ